MARQARYVDVVTGLEEALAELDELLRAVGEAVEERDRLLRAAAEIHQPRITERVQAFVGTFGGCERIERRSRLLVCHVRSQSSSAVSSSTALKPYLRAVSGSLWASDTPHDTVNTLPAANARPIGQWMSPAPP